MDFYLSLSLQSFCVYCTGCALVLVYFKESQCIGITFKNKIVCAVVFIFTHFSCFTHTKNPNKKSPYLSVYLLFYIENVNGFSYSRMAKNFGTDIFTIYWNAKSMAKRRQKSSYKAIFLLRIASHQLLSSSRTSFF